jgi:hypothetical protein
MGHGAWSMEHGAVCAKILNCAVSKFHIMLFLSQMFFSVQFELHAPCHLTLQDPSFIKVHLAYLLIIYKTMNIEMEL